MSKTDGWRHVRFLAILASGSLAACGSTSKKAATEGAGGASGAGAGHPEVGGRGGITAPGSAGAAGATAPSAAGGAAGAPAPGSGGAAGAHQVAGGAVGSLGGAPNGSTGSGGAAGGNAGTSGGPGGAGSGPVIEPYFRAGSRLKPRVFRAGDLEVLDGTLETDWYDTKTGVRCLFRVGAGGIERCFPDTVVADDASSPLSYLDAACTRPAVRDAFSHCDDVLPHYLTIEPASDCNYRTYRLGAVLPSDTPLYQKGPASCRRLPASTEGSNVLPLEEEVPPETFVAVKRVSRPRHPRMNALVREGEDGSSEIVGFSDPARETPCFGLGLEVSPQVCVPSWAQTGGDSFSDATCTQLVGFDLSPRCVARANTTLLQLGARAASEHAGACGTQAVNGLWQSEGVRSTPVFTTAGGVCEGQSTEPTVVQTSGAPIDLASLPRLDLIEVGSGPLKVAFYGFDGVPFLPAPRGIDSGAYPGPFIDVARGEPCQQRIFSDGTWRCVPSSFQAVMDFHLLYESEDCTGTRAYDPIPYCWDATREARGVIVQTLLPSVCKDYLVSETLELDGSSSAPSLSNPGLSMTCRPYSNSASTVLTVGKALNPADVFVPMERTLKD